LKYFDPELVDSFVENKNSDIKVICSDLHIFCHNVSVQENPGSQILTPLALFLIVHSLSLAQAWLF
jgi:hypothetical protein